MDVKVLVIADHSFSGGIQKGDVLEVVPSNFDWGLQTTAPRFVRLTITNVPGDTQQAAEDTIRQYLDSWRNGFTYTEETGAAPDAQRYRVQVDPDIGMSLPTPLQTEIRDAVLTEFTGVLVEQTPGSHFLFDANPGIPLDEIAITVDTVTGSRRRYRFDPNVIDSAMVNVQPGEPAYFSRTASWVVNNVRDKLKGG